MEPSGAEGSRARVAVFLDRDGVINRRAAEGAYIRDKSEFELVPRAAASLAALKRAGAELFVVTNQRGVARGLVDPGDLDEIHRVMSEDLARESAALGGIYTCPHEIGQCDCRKPAPGLFLQAQADHPWIDFAHSHLIGDSMNDVEAGHRLGISIWIVDPEGDVAAAARERGIGVAGAAPTLAELVQEGALVAAITGAR